MNVPKNGKASIRIEITFEGQGMHVLTIPNLESLNIKGDVAFDKIDPSRSHFVQLKLEGRGINYEVIPPGVENIEEGGSSILSPATNETI